MNKSKERGEKLDAIFTPIETEARASKEAYAYAGYLFAARFPQEFLEILEKFRRSELS